MPVHTPQIYPTPAELAGAAANLFAQTVRAAVARRAVCRVALAGGSTPQAMYRLLAAAPLAGRVPWERLQLFWGDERCVPPDHPDSNYGAARQSLLKFVPIPAGNIYPMPAQEGPAQGAEAYHRTLTDVFAVAGALPVFDLILLGIGPDGHTASLFPRQAALNETSRWAAPVFNAPKPPPERITLTLPVINAARRVAILAAGANKTGAVRAALTGSLFYPPGEAEGYPTPAGQVNPAGGELHWLVDRAAAGRLS